MKRRHAQLEVTPYQETTLVTVARAVGTETAAQRDGVPGGVA